MADSQIRELQRRVAAGDPSARRELVRVLLRSGHQVPVGDTILVSEKWLHSLPIACRDKLIHDLELACIERGVHNLSIAVSVRVPEPVAILPIVIHYTRSADVRTMAAETVTPDLDGSTSDSHTDDRRTT